MAGVWYFGAVMRNLVVTVVMEELLLFTAGVMAGTIDAAVGGGGLIGIPALLLYGVVPLEALSTNKLQSIVGKVVATWRYARAGLFKSISLRSVMRDYVVPCLVWGSVGAMCATLLDSAFLELWIPVNTHKKNVPAPGPKIPS